MNVNVPTRPWYSERYLVTQLHGEPVFGYRIREEGSNRVIAKDLNRLEAEMICEHMNKVTVGSQS